METETEIVAKDVYSLVTNRIIDLLENGVIPWRKTWRTAGIPKNLISQRQYSGINLLLLNALDFKQNVFLTWNQLKEIGGSVRKGEKGSFVVFQSKKEDTIEEDGELKVKVKFLLRYYKVFNVGQCTDLPPKYESLIDEIINEPIVSCESVVEGMPNCPNIIHSKSASAYYSANDDYIQIPEISSFESSSAYYGTLFHELIHATGAEFRLNRKTITEHHDFNSEEYSIEELIAEIGSCYLKSVTDVPIEDLENSASYIDHWLKVLRGDKKMIVQASNKAQMAVNFILNKGGENN
jgi:antirestriction protein ArdC